MLLAGACLGMTCPAMAQSASPEQAQKPAATTQSPQKMTKETRLQVIRSLQSERVFARVMIPQGDKGLVIRDGQVTPSQSVISQQLADFGPAAKPGDRCVITNVEIKDKEIVLDINGGGKKKQKWYQHIQVGGVGGGTAPVPGTPAPQSLDAHGSSVTLAFDKFVPEMSGDDIRSLLAPVFDFKALTSSEAFQKTLPPKLKEAIHEHRVLVGMDKEMVMYSKGRPNQRIRDKDAEGNDYEEWIYGTPPEQVEFVRFKGDEVARLEIMSVDGKKEIRTAREIDMSTTKPAEVAEKKPVPQPQDGPTLLRPGEQAEGPVQASDHRTTRTQDCTAPADGSPSPDSCTKNVPTIPPISPNDGTPHLAPGK